MSGRGTQSITSSFLKNYNIYAFSTATLDDILSKFSEPNLVKVAVTCLLMVSYIVIYQLLINYIVVRNNRISI